jgi:lipoprotein-anchoring transpeptidase ErfK/SrfK
MRYFLSFLLVITAFFFLPHSVHADIITSDKLITVDTGKQMLYAWEGGQIKYQTKVSTGMYYTPTVKGSFNIYKKYPLQDMKGHYRPYEPYSIKNVPNVMYFYQAYAIHGAYWHNSFGSKYTHGCVNLPVDASQWVYNWAEVGTRVEVF